MPGSKFRRRTAALAVLVCAACSGGRQVAPTTVAASAPPASSSIAAPADLTPAQIAERATPSVVSIRSPDSLGSGFVVKKPGWVATNLHVIANAKDLVAVSSEGVEFAVLDVLAVDPDHDLALLRIDAAALPELAVGDSNLVHPGDRVVAIGHPLGLEDTISNGLVSAVRKVSPDLTLLQISAPIAPGSSGGPLIDEKGRVIGIATAVSREGQNLAFGVPTEYLTALLASASPVPWKDFVALREAAAPPAPKRDIPHHEIAMLNGCGDGDLQMLTNMISDAIDVGAPLFNGGNFAACFHVYEGASADADRKLGAGCTGPKRALAAGRKKAGALDDPAAQAWAMRDAFDGLLDVIDRKFHPK